MDLPEVEFQRYWRRLQRLGLNAYEARAWLVLVGNPRMKALDLAARATVPRQKIYEVLESLIEKGFAQVLQERTKLFSAVEPNLAIPTYLTKRESALQHEQREQARMAGVLMDDLISAYGAGRPGRTGLDFLRVLTDHGQIAAQYQRLLRDVTREYLEFSRPPYAIDPLDERLVTEAHGRGVACRLIVDSEAIDDAHARRTREYAAQGIAIRTSTRLPAKLALFDGDCGLLALLDPLVQEVPWTAVVFRHQGLGEAMNRLFEERWHRATPMLAAEPALA